MGGSRRKLGEERLVLLVHAGEGRKWHVDSVSRELSCRWPGAIGCQVDEQDETGIISNGLCKRRGEGGTYELMMLACSVRIWIMRSSKVSRNQILVDDG